jgi:hypothetical protein
MRGLRAAAVLLATLVLAGCTSMPSEDAPDPAPASSSLAATPSETPPPDPGPKPKVGECHALSFGQAVAVVGRSEPVACTRKHTAQTYFVGRLDLETKAGFSRRVDSEAAQRQMRQACTTRLPRHLGIGPRELRLSMAQAVWFTPSPKRAEAGADWFRCDVVAVAAPKQLLALPRQTKGWGDAPAAAMCATAEPGTKAFRRVSCGARHTWRASSTVDLPGKGRLPKQAEIADRMESTCRDAARSQADDPLDFTWSQESPTEEQWEAGQRYGICWVPA